MNRNNLYLRFSGFVILMAIMACALPGQKAQPIPTSTFDPVMATSIVGTVQASTRLTEQSYTPTPIPTETLIPTPVISSYGTSLTKRDDGSALFTDHRAGIQILFPANWLALRMGEPEYYQAWETETTKSPVFMNVFTSMQSSDPNVFRVTVIDIRPEPVTYENFSKMEFLFSSDDKRTLNEIRVDETQNPPPLVNYKLLSSSLEKTSNGLDAAVIEFQWESTSPENITSMNYHKNVMIKVPTGTIAIQLFTKLDQKDNMLALFDQMLGSLVFLTQ